MNDSCDSGECPTRLPEGMLSEYDLTRQATDGIAVWLESTDSIGTVSLEAVGKARELDNGRVFGILFGDSEKRSLYSEAFEYGVDTIYHIRSPGLNTFRKDAYAEAIKEITEKVRSAALMIPNTDNGSILMDALSTIFGREFSDREELSGPFPALVCVHPGNGVKRQEGRKGTAINVVPSEKVRSLIE